MRATGVVVILAVAISLSISMLIARDAVNAKINTVKASTGTTITVAPAGFFGFSGGGTPLSTSEITSLLAIKNVVAVQATLTENLRSGKTSLTAPTPPGFLGRQSAGTTGSSSGNGFGSQGFTLPIRVVGTNSPGTALVGGAFGGGTETLTSGHAFSSTSTSDVAIVGTNLATTNKLKVGSTFTAWGAKVTVVGIYSSGSTFADSDVVMPLATVQKLADAAGQITGATVTVNSVSNVTSAQAAISTLLGSKADVTSTASTTAAALAPLNSVRSISTYTLYGSLIGAAVILLLSMLMIVRERRREIGVLKALGAPNRSIVGQFIAESSTFTLLGSLVGLIGGIIISSPITNALVSATSSTTSAPGGFVRGGPGGFGGGGNGFGGGFGGGGGGFGGGFGHFHNFGATIAKLHTTVGLSTLLFALVAALLIAAAGSTLASATVVRIRPAEVLRSE